MRFWRWTRPLRPARAEPREGAYQRYDAYSKLLDRNARWIEVADTKAAVILGVIIATFPVLIAPAFSAVRTLIGVIPAHPQWWAYLPLLAFMTLCAVFTVVALKTFIWVLKTLKPRLSSPRKPSLVYFGDIARAPWEEWSTRTRALPPEDLAHEVLEQVHVTACIAEVKHKCVQRAVNSALHVVLLGCALYVISQFIIQVIR